MQVPVVTFARATLRPQGPSGPAPATPALCGSQLVAAAACVSVRIHCSALVLHLTDIPINDEAIYDGISTALNKRLHIQRHRRR